MVIMPGMRLGPIVAIIPVASDDPAIALSILGRPVIAWTLRRLQSATRIERIILAVDGVSGAAAMATIGSAEDDPPPATATGPDRASAIRAALELAGPADAVLLCPPDRPLGGASIVDELTVQADGVDAVAAARPVRSTLKRVDDGRVVATVPRDSWRSDAGPWLFRRDALERALAVSETTGRPVVDGHDLALGAGLLVRLIDADATDLSIRTPADARFAERWLASIGGPAR